MTDSTKTLMALQHADISLMGQIVNEHVCAGVSGVSDKSSVISSLTDLGPQRLTSIYTVDDLDVVH